MKPTKEKRKELKKEAEKRMHKCYGCVWGRWTGIGYKCMFGRCVKGEM